jgi:hypothetical protein
MHQSSAVNRPFPHFPFDSKFLFLFSDYEKKIYVIFIDISMKGDPFVRKQIGLFFREMVSPLNCGIFGCMTT